MRIAFVVPFLLAFAIAARAAEPTDKVQSACEKTAAKWFKSQWNDGTFADERGTWSASYQSHFHAASNRCYIVIDSAGATHAAGEQEKKLRHLNAVDLTKTQDWAGYSDETDASGNMTMYECYVGETECQTLAEWQSLMKAYMTD